jgi:hypothetical protein
MRSFIGLIVLLVGCGGDDSEQQCSGSACGSGPRIQLTAQEGFGSLRCDGEAENCVLDFGILAPGRASESWTDLQNVGDSILNLSALTVTDPIFEVRQPAMEIGPGESISFRLRVRLDAAGLNHEAQLHLDSDAVNGAADSTGCTNEVLNCSRITVTLRAQTDS